MGVDVRVESRKGRRESEEQQPGVAPGSPFFALIRGAGLIQGSLFGEGSDEETRRGGSTENPF